MDDKFSSWGIESVGLQLPIFNLLINGLSLKQRRAIDREFSSFTVGPNKGTMEADVVCRAAKLKQSIGIPPKRFLVNGQYTPLKRRSHAGIEITGFDFAGRFFLKGTTPVRAELAVAEQEKLIQPGALENFLRILTAYLVLKRGGVLLHSAGILHQHRAYLFCGRSNAGKTTLARKADAAGARVLSDDINLVIPENGAFRAHKVPFTGEFGRRAENLSGNGSFPLGGLALLEKAPALTAAPVRSAEAVAGLLTGCPFVNDDPEEFSALLDILTKLVANTPVIRLGVGRDDPFDAVMDTLLRHCKHD